MDENEKMRTLAGFKREDGTVYTVGELKRELEKYQDDMLLTSSDGSEFKVYEFQGKLTISSL